MTMPQRALPPENILRGTLFGLIIVPLGVVLWLIIWSLGFIASFVSLVVAIGAAFLYTKGSGGRISGLGAVIVMLTTIVTMTIAFIGGLVLDVVMIISQITGMPWLDALSHPEFGMAYDVYLDENSSQLWLWGLLSIGFAALGSFGTLRTVFQQSKAQAESPVAFSPTPAGFEPITPSGFGSITPAGYDQTPPPAYGQTPPAASGQTPPPAPGQTPPSATGWITPPPPPTGDPAPPMTR